ncbi:SDR family oxidoreductase [Pedobacter sp. SYSU D00535]|uniref:SDR family oxidoreductase n=1 Tax=Pedobacter sp. SYSU D00535 TaxID=2810308 RepID=UPI001A95761A|nr:SDR family oxidoreductase [Pedobacter sp. SYSU D00535]
MDVISILGAGWLGLPLGRFLKRQGYELKGSVTSFEKFGLLQEAGIQPFRLMLSPELEGENTDSFFQCDLLIVNFPPKRRPDIEEYHSAQMTALLEEIRKHGIKKVLFVSSSSVYPDVNREVFEYEDLEPEKGSGKALRMVEQLLMDEAGLQTTILRFGGLVGHDRQPGRFLAAKKDVPNGDAPVNLIHQDDCIGIIHQLIKQQVAGGIFNACAEKHPLRKDYYRQAALQIGLEPPEFAQFGEVRFKIVNSEKIRKTLNYTFKYPDPMGMLKP